MIWLTWRQFRAQATVVFTALAALAAVLALTGPNLAHDYSTGIAACTAHGGCSTFTSAFFKDHENPFLGLVLVVMFVPGIIGLFWGAPLITRELEAGTHRLVWNQSVTRTRWLAVKLALTGLAAMAAAGLGSLAVTWWSSPIDKTAVSQFPRLSPMMFDARGIVPLGYAAFAFALGVTIGMLIRRTLPAMAITLVVFVAVQIAMPMLVRPHLLPPTRLTTAITAENVHGIKIENDGGNAIVNLSVDVDAPGAWVLSNQTVDKAGRAVSGISVSTADCVPTTPPDPLAEGPPIPPGCFTKISQLGYRQQVAYHSAGRFWAFQWYETTIFLALTLGLSGFCFWRIRRRPS